MTVQTDMARLDTDTAKELSARVLALQARHNMLQEHYHHIRSHYLLIVCAWCQKHIRWQLKEDASFPVHTSHGICPACVVNVSRELGVMAPILRRLRMSHAQSCRERHSLERSISHMSENTPRSPVEEEPQPAIGEALLRMVRENRLRTHVIHAAARAARQCAKEVQKEARSACTLARAACEGCRYLLTQLHSHAYVR